MLTAVIDGMADGLMIVDRKGHIVLANRALHRWFGYDSLVGSKLDDLVPVEVAGGEHAELVEGFFRSPSRRLMARRLVHGVNVKGEKTPEFSIALSDCSVLGVRYVAANCRFSQPDSPDQ